MRKLIDYFWSFVRRGNPKPYEHGPAKKFVTLDNLTSTVERDEYGRFIEPIEEGCGENCKCKDK